MDAAQPAAWSTDVIGIGEMQLSADYWVEQLENANQLLEDQKAIAAFNKGLFATDPNMVDLAQFPDQLSGVDVRARIQAISKPGNSDLYNTAGEILGAEGYRKYTDNLGLQAIAASVDVRFALVVKRAAMRTYPTDDRYYKVGEEQNLDRFQENALFPGDAVAVLHTSADSDWSFVQSYNYAAWVISLSPAKTLSGRLSSSSASAMAGGIPIMRATAPVSSWKSTKRLAS